MQGFLVVIHDWEGIQFICGLHETFEKACDHKSRLMELIKVQSARTKELDEISDELTKKYPDIKSPEWDAFHEKYAMEDLRYGYCKPNDVCIMRVDTEVDAICCCKEDRRIARN